MDFLIGGVSGAAATLISNPFDVIKTRMQLQGELGRARRPAPYRGTAHAAVVIARADGLAALQRGLLPSVCFGFTMNFVRLGLFRTLQTGGWTTDAEGQLSAGRTMACSSLCGSAAALVGNPASVVKTRLQAMAHPSIAVGRQHQYKGTVDAVRQIWRAEGWRGYFAGTGASCARIAVGSTAQLTTYSKTKELLVRHGLAPEGHFQQTLCASAACSVAVALAMNPLDVVSVRLFNQGNWLFGPPGIARQSTLLYRTTEYLRQQGLVHSELQGSVLAGLFTTMIIMVVESPLDVVNTRLLNDGTGSEGSKYNGVIDCIRKVYTNEGPRGFYKGLGPLYLRIAPHSIISLVIWDTLNSMKNGDIKNLS